MVFAQGKGLLFLNKKHLPCISFWLRQTASFIVSTMSPMTQFKINAVTNFFKEKHKQGMEQIMALFGEI